MKRYFIINRMAGSGRAVEHWNKQKNKYSLNQDDHEIIVDWSQLKLKARECLGKGADLIIAVGGDGTAGQVASAFFQEGRNIFPEACFTCIPVGTGCDFFRSTAGKTNPWVLLTQGRKKAIDVVRLQTEDDDVYAINTVSLGITTKVMEYKEGLPPWVPNFLSYLIPAVRAVLSWTSKTVSFKIDQKTNTKLLMALFICKGRYGGGGMMLGDADKQDSGVLAVTMVPPISFQTFLRNLLRLYLKGLRTLSFVEPMEAKSLTFSNDGYSVFEADGELYSFETLKIDTLERSLTTLVP